MSFQIYHPDGPHTKNELKLAQVLAPLSHALDMTEGQSPGHCVRCAYIGTRIGEVLGLGDSLARDLYYTLLLKDLGCSSNAARICELYLADDINFKRDFKVIDGSLSSALRFVFAQTGLNSGLSERFRAVVNILQNGGKITQDLIETRCHRGADIARKMRFSTVVQAGIMSLDEHWDGGGKPEGLKGHDIPLLSNIALLAQVVDIFLLSGGRHAAMTEVRRRSGAWFDPELVHVMDLLSHDPGFWADLADPAIEQIVFDLDPGQSSAKIDESYLDDIAAAFSDVIDAKSPFTADHSNRVTLYADVIAEELGLGQGHRRWLRRGTLLHDLGKLSVSNQVLDKPAKLDDAEWAIIQTHPGNGARILDRIDVFRDISAIAGHHHEKLNGRGYPYGLAAPDLALEVRITTVADVFDALSAERPYRGPMPITQVFDILQEGAGTAFDPLCIEALRSGLDRMGARAA